MSPLAYKIRPKSFEDVYGQELLCGKSGIFTTMAKTNSYRSFVLFGNPGSGKTTIANIFASNFKHSFKFNAATDSKQVLKDIVTQYKMFFPCLLIIDEIHRMNKDIQDFLLPYTESGELIIIGLTTENPYHVLTPQLRSRLLIYKLENINKDTLISYLKDVSGKYFNKVLTDEIYDFIATSSNLEIRTALNILEVAFQLEVITLDNLSKAIGIKAKKIDRNGINYYDLLSALIKSIRGSDVDAALYYTACFLEDEDLIMLKRRLLILAYEDVGLANPSLQERVKTALDSAIEVGLPEARIMISYAVILLATSPKSNSCYKAINDAISFVKNNEDYTIPSHILNREIKSGSNYLYPHDYQNNFIKQLYLPEKIKDKVFYNYGNNKYEVSLSEYYEKIRKILKS